MPPRSIYGFSIISGPTIGGSCSKVDETFVNIMCHSSHSASSDLVAPRSVPAPARLTEVDESLTPKSWTYDDPHVPEGMRIAAPPNRAMHDSHMRKMNAFLRAVHKKPENFHAAILLKREMEEILSCITDGRWSRHDQGCFGWSNGHLRVQKPKRWLFDKVGNLTEPSDLVVKLVEPLGRAPNPRSCNPPVVLQNIITCIRFFFSTPRLL